MLDDLSRHFAVLAAGLSCVLASLVFAVPAGAGTGVGSSGNTITNAAQAQSPFTAGTFDSGQPIDVVVPANTVFTPGANIFILECAAPGGVNPTTSTNATGTPATRAGPSPSSRDGSVDVINTSTSFGTPYTIYALPDAPVLHESPTSTPKCGLGSANECVLYIGQGGGSDTGFSQPHFFSQAFQVHPDPTDSGTLTPGDGTFPADSAPAITSANNATFTEGTAGTFTVTATGYGPPAFTETGALPAGVTLKTTFSGNTSTGVLAGTPTASRHLPDHHHRQQRGRHHRHPVLHPDRQRNRHRSRHHLGQPRHLHQGHGRHLHGDRHRLSRAHLHRDRFPAHRGHPVHGRRALGHPHRQRHLPDHHHRRQRGHPQRHPELHPRPSDAAAGHHLGQPPPPSPKGTRRYASP